MCEANIPYKTMHIMLGEEHKNTGAINLKT